MSIKYNQYTVTAKALFEDEKDSPEYDWSTNVELRLNDHVLPAKACIKFMADFQQLLISYAPKLTNISAVMNEKDSKTKLEAWQEKLKAAKDALAKSIMNNDELEVRDELEIKLHELTDQHPDWDPGIPTPEDYEQAVADLNPEFKESK